MKKKIFFFLFLSLFILSAFAEDIVISRSQLADFKEQMKTAYGYTPDELYRFYNQNAVKFENDFKYKAFKIKGYVSRIRRGFFDEYIVELKCNENWVSDLAVVYPSRISEAMKNDLMNLNIGEYFEALVVGRAAWFYVDVPVWNSNGTYRTEP